MDDESRQSMPADLPERALRALADALTDQYPGLTFVPSENGTLPAVGPADRP